MRQHHFEIGTPGQTWCAKMSNWWKRLLSPFIGLCLIFVLSQGGCVQSHPSPPLKSNSALRQPQDSGATHSTNDLSTRKTGSHGKTKKYVPPLFDAINRGSVRDTTALLHKNANPNATDADGMTVLMYSLEEGPTDTAKLLLAHGADVNAKTNAGGTALMLAASKGNISGVNLLLAHGAKVNERTKAAGYTALMFVANTGQTTIVKTLLAHGADARIKSVTGHTARDFAMLRKHTDTAAVLAKAEKQQMTAFSSKQKH